MRTRGRSSRSAQTQLSGPDAVQGVGRRPQIRTGLQSEPISSPSVIVSVVSRGVPSLLRRFLGHPIGSTSRVPHYVKIRWRNIHWIIQNGKSGVGSLLYYWYNININ